MEIDTDSDELALNADKQPGPSTPAKRKKPNPKKIGGAATYKSKYNINTSCIIIVTFYSLDFSPNGQ